MTKNPSPPSEAELWNGALGQKWATDANDFDHMLAALNPLLLDMASPLASPQNILDIGCGSGAMALEAARRVEPDGRVEGVDISQILIDTARARTHNVKNLRFSLSDMDSYMSEHPFDQAISRLGVMFFSDPIASFARIRTLLVANGRLSFVCWRALKHNQWAALPYATALSFLDTDPPRPAPGTPGPFAFAQQERILDILTQSGWQDIQIRTWEGALTLPGQTLEDSVRFALKFGPAARLIQNHDLDNAQLAILLAERFRALGLQAGKATLGASAWLVQACS